MKPLEAKPALWRKLDEAITIKVFRFFKWWIVIKESKDNNRM